MKYKTKTGNIEIISKEDGAFEMYENGDFRGSGRVVFCSPGATNMETLDVVKEPIGAVAVFWQKDDKSTSPCYISPEIVEVLN